jgi:hypothetical protein
MGPAVPFWALFGSFGPFWTILVVRALFEKFQHFVHNFGRLQGWQVLPMPGFNHGLNPGLNRVGQNPKNPVTVGKTG